MTDTNLTPVVEDKRKRQALLQRLFRFRGRLPKDFVFDREEANTRESDKLLHRKK